LHVFEAAHLPYEAQKFPGLEFAEVASMSMELLAAPYISRDEGGFYSEPEAARARVEHLERMISLWTTVASVQAFQAWIYANPGDARDPDKLNAKWAELRERYIPRV